MSESEYTVEQMIIDLRDSESSTRRHAAQSLGYSDERAIYPLIKTLRDPNPGVQDAAMHSLVNIGGEVVAYMIVPLLREDSYLRNTAQLMLRDLGPVSVPFLYPLLKDKDDDIRKFALDLFGDICEGVDGDTIVPLVSDPNPNVRASAIRALGLLNHAGAIDLLIHAAHDEEWVAFSAIETLGILQDERAVDAIVEILRIGSHPIRIAAIETLGRIGSARASDALLAHIARAEGDEKIEALKSLVTIGITPDMKEVSDLLLTMFTESGWEGRLIAIKGLADLRHTEAIPMIIDLAGTLDESVPGDDDKLMQIKSALVRFGPSDAYADILLHDAIKYKGKMLAAELAGKSRTESAVPALIASLESKVRDIRREAARALGLIGTPQAREALIRTINDPESNVRKTAIVCLGFTPDAASFEPLLKHLDDEPYNDIIEETVKTLLKIDETKLFTHLPHFNDQIKEAIGRFCDNVDILLNLSHDKNLGVKLSALSRLGGYHDQRAVDRVLDAIHEDDPEVRRSAVLTLGDMDVGHERIRPLLKDSDMWVRLHAVRSLGQSLRLDMIETLSPMLHDADVPVVLAAIEAVTLIGGRDAFSALSAIVEHEDETVRRAVREVLERL